MGFSCLCQKFRVKWDGIEKDSMGTVDFLFVKQFTAA